MIDTLVFNLGSPLLRAGHKLTLQPRPTKEGLPQGQPLVLRLDTGEVIETGKAYFNDKETGVHISPSHGGLFLQVSLPKVQAEGKDNVSAITQDQAQGCIETLQTYLADQAGVIVDLDQAGVSRADLFSNADSKFSFNDYRTLFDTLNFKRQVKRDFGSTYEFHNGQRETCIYSKIDEMKAKHKDTTGLPTNLIRWEYRLKNGTACKAGLGTRKADRLTAGDLVQRWDELWPVYHRELKTALRLDRSEGGADIHNLKAELIHLKQRQGTKALETWVDIHGVNDILHTAGNIDAVRGVLKEADYNKQQVYRFMTKFIETLQTQFDFKNNVSIQDLKRELYSKLCDNYKRVA